MLNSRVVIVEQDRLRTNLVSACWGSSEIASGCPGPGRHQRIIHGDGLIRRGHQTAVPFQLKTPTYITIARRSVQTAGTIHMTMSAHYGIVRRGNADCPNRWIGMAVRCHKDQSRSHKELESQMMSHLSILSISPSRGLEIPIVLNQHESTLTRENVSNLWMHFRRRTRTRVGQGFEDTPMRMRWNTKYIAEAETNALID
jgi:hypothetical protein